MTRPRGSWRPEHLPEEVWREVVRQNPGAALVEWFEAHLGARIETEGQNRGRWLREVLFGGEGHPWCAAAIVTGLDEIAGPELPRHRHGAHPRWSNRSVQNLEDACRREGLWMGPAVLPRVGDMAFQVTRGRSDSGPGRHVDLVRRVDPDANVVDLIGGNVGDTFALTLNVPLGDPRITGFGRIGDGLEDLRRAL